MRMWIKRSIIAGVMWAGLCGQIVRGGDLAEGFQTPAADYRPDVWWRFFGDEITSAGAEEDIRQMASAGILHAQMFHLRDTSTGPVEFLTPKWWEVMTAAGKEAGRVGVHISPQSMSGWSVAAGPWITPELSMQKLVWSSRLVSGQGPFALTKPETARNYYRDVAVLAYPVSAEAAADLALKPAVTLISGKAEGDLNLLVDGDANTFVKLKAEPGKNDITLDLAYERPVTIRSITLTPMVQGSYMAGQLNAWGGELQAETSPGQFKRVAGVNHPVTALPATTAQRFRLRVRAPEANLVGGRVCEVELSPESRLHQALFKTGAVAALAPEPHPVALAASPGIDPASIIDLTGKMDASGKLDWSPPSGEWMVLRLGQTTAERLGRNSTKSGGGLESDKLSTEATAIHFDAYSGKFLKTINDAAGSPVVSEIFMDSWEAGSQNWTATMPAEFLRRRGYDLKSYLPALTGRVVGDIERTERFLWDFRRTIADLIADNFYGVMRQKSNKLGAKLVAEAPGPFHSLPPVCDPLQAKGRANVPMGEYLNPAGVMHDYDPKEAASAAHIYGKNIVAAEDFSWFNNKDPHGGGQFNSPQELLRVEHLAFCQGINRVTLTTFVHQADREKSATKGPGWGPVLNSPWWALARPYTEYLARCQYLLRQGLFVADICYFYGEQTPNTLHHAYQTDLHGPQKEIKAMPLPGGYDFDECNAEVLLTRMSVKDGRLMLPDGMSYRILVLVEQQTMTLPVLEKIAELVKAGATVVGPKPLKSPGLAGQPQADERIRLLANQVWGDCDGKSITQHPFGLGRVFWGLPVEQVLRDLKTEPDFAVVGEGEGTLLYIHRRQGPRDIYFVFNRSEKATTRTCRFRVAGGKAEIWDALTGHTRPIASTVVNGGTEITLSFEPYGATFVVFDEERTPTPPDASPTVSAATVEITGPWSVTFKPMAFCDTPFEVTMPTLTPWNRHEDRNVRHFAGQATYRSKFMVEPAVASRPAQLDLGQNVGDIAEVKLNGKPAGSVWMPPYRLDVSGLVKAGENELEIVVANRWINRLLGEIQNDPPLPPAMKDNPFKDKQTPLVEAGLSGPVTLRVK